MIERRQSEADKRMSHVFPTGKRRETSSQFEEAREERVRTLFSGLMENE